MVWCGVVLEILRQGEISVCEVLSGLQCGTAQGDTLSVRYVLCHIVTSRATAATRQRDSHHHDVQLLYSRTVSLVRHVSQ